MLRCLDVTGMLYRVASVRVACRLLSVCIGREIRGKEFKSIYHSISEEKRTCVLQDGLLIDETIFRRDTWQTYQNAQADVPFYIPKKEEIQEYSTYGYPDSDDRYRGLKEFLLSEAQMDAEDVRDSLSEIWEIFSSGIDFTESMAMVEQAGFRFTEKGKQKRFAGLLEDAFRHTRTFIYKGWTEAEIRARQGIES